eukprot:gene13404-biopygen5025
MISASGGGSLQTSQCIGGLRRTKREDSSTTLSQVRRRCWKQGFSPGGSSACIGITHPGRSGGRALPPPRTGARNIDELITQSGTRRAWGRCNTPCVGKVQHAVRGEGATRRAWG